MFYSFNFFMELSLITNNVKYITSISIPIIFSLYKEIIIRMINVCKLILRHVKEYCQEAAIHGPQHIVSPRLAIFERLVLLPMMYISLYSGQKRLKSCLRRKSMPPHIKRKWIWPPMNLPNSKMLSVTSGHLVGIQKHARLFFLW